MSFVERVNQGESLASWLTEPPAVSWSVIMGDLSAIWKGEIWTHPNAFRMGPGSCAVHSMEPGIHRSTVNSPQHKGQWRGALMFTLICTRINGWVNTREAGDLRRHHTNYDVIVMSRVIVNDDIDCWTSPGMAHRKIEMSVTEYCIHYMCT